MKHSKAVSGNLTWLTIAAAVAAAVSACGPSQEECFRANQCVRACGGPVVTSGCAPCAAGTFDNIVCDRDASDADATSDVPADAISDAPSDAPPPEDVPADVNPSDVTPIDAGPFSCGTQTCGANQICVMPCSGIDSGMPVLPFCTDPPAGCGATPTCGCLSPGICPPASPPFAGCRQDSDRHFTCSGCV